MADIRSVLSNRSLLEYSIRNAVPALVPKLRFPLGSQPSLLYVLLHGFQFQNIPGARCVRLTSLNSSRHSDEVLECFQLPSTKFREHKRWKRNGSRMRTTIQGSFVVASSCNKDFFRFPLTRYLKPWIPNSIVTRFLVRDVSTSISKSIQILEGRVEIVSKSLRAIRKP